MNKLLSQVKKTFESTYIIACHENKVLEFSIDKKSLPFALVMYEDNFPNTILVSLSVDYHANDLLASFIIKLGYVGKIQLTEGFYLDDAGVCFLGEEAYNEYHKDGGLMNAKAISDAIN